MIKVLEGLVPSKAVKETLFHASSLVCGGLLALCGIPLIVDASPCSLISSVHGALRVCASESKFLLFINTQS